MSIGLQCIDESGSVYFDTNTQQYYHLIGKFVSRVENDYAYGTWVRVPRSYDSDSHLLCMMLEEWRSPTRGNKWYMGVYVDGGGINFIRVGNTYRGDPDFTSVSLAVFSKKPLTENSNGFGLDCYDDSMVKTFSSFSDSSCLQINNYKTQSSPFLGTVGAGNAIILSALPYQVLAPGEGYYNVETSLFRGNGASVESGFGSIGAKRVLAGYSFPYFSVATVTIPDVPIPTLPW